MNNQAFFKKDKITHLCTKIQKNYSGISHFPKKSPVFSSSSDNHQQKNIFTDIYLLVN